MLKALDEWKDWHKKFGNYLLLKEKLEVICWRNLIRRTSVKFFKAKSTVDSLFNRLFVVTNGQPLPPTGPPSLSLHELLITARVAFGDQSLDIDDVESMCASLMEQVSHPSTA